MSNLSRFGDIDILHSSCPTLVNQFWQLEADAGFQRKLFIDFAHQNPNAFSCFADFDAKKAQRQLSKVWTTIALLTFNLALLYKYLSFL